MARLLLAAIAVALVAGPRDATRYVDPAGWSLTYPRTLHLERSAARLRIDVSEVTIASFAPRRAVRTGSTSSGAWLRLDPPRDRDGAFPSDGVAFRIVSQEGGPAPDVERPETPFPLRLSDFPNARPQPVTADGRNYLAYVWIGSRAPAELRARLAGVVSSLAFPRLRPGETVGYGFTVLERVQRYPVGSFTRVSVQRQPFYLVRAPGGLYGIGWRWQSITGGYKSRCDLRLDRRRREFFCTNLRARWDRVGRVLVRPRGAARGDPLNVAVAKVSWDGHVLLYPGSARFADARFARRLWPDTCPSARPFRPGRLGAVAYRRGGALRVVELTSGRDRQLARVGDRPLRWSPDGRWIAVGDTLVAAASGATCRPFGVGASNLQWRPHARTLIADVRGRVLVASGRPLLPRGFAVGAAALEPSGTRLVAQGRRGSLWVLDLATGRRTRIWQSPTPLGRVGPPTGERWAIDGEWILFQTDTYRSSSIAADGLPLWAIRRTGGRAIQVEPHVLTAADFVQDCGATTVVSAGFDRYVSAHKRIDVAVPPSWSPRRVSPDRRESWYAATCSPDGSHIAATVTPNRDEGRFDSAERSIRLIENKAWRLLVGKPGDGASDEQPRWSRDGRWILYLHHAARTNATAMLYLVDVASGKRRGPFARISGGLGYYGYHDWNDLAAWYQPAASS
ncbi:MAG TPA: hypothetical protein VF101_16440 [Gaiellaceae bacterium]